MKTKALALAVALLAASSAQADPMLVAGWDFSQYTPGFLSTDGASLTDTLSANYSDLDPNGLGAESAAFGTMYLDGRFGSFDTPADFVTPDPFRPQTPNLTQNTDMAQEPMGSAGAGNILLNEGQFQFQEVSMVAGEAEGLEVDVLDVVFGANVLGTGLVAGDWQVSFAGRTAEQSSDVVVEFSTDGGSSYDSIRTEELTPVDTQFIVDLGGLDLTEAFVRLRFDASETIRPTIDNVAVKATLVPEPGTLLLTLAGLAGLGVARRRA